MLCQFLVMSKQLILRPCVVVKLYGDYTMELSKQEYLEKFSLCAIDNDSASLQKIYISLIKQRTVLDRWFDKYLDMFDRKMSTDNTDTPIWKLYKQKLNEYSELNGVITTANAYLNKLKNV